MGSNYIMGHVHYAKENSIKINAFFFLANAHDYLYKSNLSSSQVHGKHYYVSIA